MDKRHRRAWQATWPVRFALQQAGQVPAASLASICLKIEDQLKEGSGRPGELATGYLPSTRNTDQAIPDRVHADIEDACDQRSRSRTVHSRPDAASLRSSPVPNNRPT
jgi:hypothetical protein